MIQQLHTRKRLYISLVSLATLLYLANTIYYRTQHHLFDLNIDELYNKTLAVYLLTTDCKRYTPDIITQFDDLEALYLVNDIDSPECLSTGHKLLNFNLRNDTRFKTQDDKYRLKWAHVMKHCGRGKKHKCLILEDDTVFLHNKQKTKEVIMTNTLTLWFSGNLAWDCARRGFGWLNTPGWGWGSQCRVFEKKDSLNVCLANCFANGEEGGREGEMELEMDMDMELPPLDQLISPCQKECGMQQGNFLLVQHGNSGSEFRDRGSGDLRFWDED
jgi:hypothetical protein